MRHAAARAGALALVVAAQNAAAESMNVDLPAGTVGQQVTALGRQARTSIVVSDPALWVRRMPALRGRMSVRKAVSTIAARAGAAAHSVRAIGWRLEPSAARPPRAPPRPGKGRTPAAESPPPVDAEIVVTASKRDAMLDQFAGQVSRVSGATLERGGTGGTERLVQRLTSVTSTYLGAGRNKLFIRGIADSSFTGPTQATVGQYYGDLRLSYNAPDPDLRLADLASVEVLEGPQGTLYGAGSLGGIIRLVPNPVDLDDLTGSVAVGTSATSHGGPGLDAQAVLNAPLVSDRIGIRLVANAATEGGYIDKPLLGRTDVNRTRVEGGRATLRLELGSDWRAELVAIGQRIRGEDSQYADRDGAPLSRSAAVTEGFRTDYGQGQLVVAGTIGDVKLRSTTGITAHDLLERYDATPEAQEGRLFVQANRTRMQANETRVWRTRGDGSGWLAGVSYIHNRTRLLRLIGTPGRPMPTTGVVNGVSEWTGYGEASARPLPGLLATAGLRATRSTLAGRGLDVSPVVAASRGAETASRTQTIVLPSAAALIDLAPGTKLFMRYQQGFRPGGLAIEGDFVRQFRNDRVATIEAGVRHSSAVLDVGMTVSRASWRDIQADFIDRSGLPSTANIGNGRLWTVEAVAGVQAFQGLRIEGGATYNDGRIDEPSPSFFALASATGAQAGAAAARAEALARLEQIPNIARFTTRIGTILSGRLGSADLTIDAWGRYIGSSRLGVGPVLGQRQGSYLDTEITARVDFGRFGLSANASNLTDARGNRFALGTPFATGRDQITPLRPRTVRIALDARF